MLVRQAFSRARRHTQLPALRPHHFPRSTCERDAFVAFECSPAAVRDPDLADLDRLVACFDHLVPYRYEPGANQTGQHSAREVVGEHHTSPLRRRFRGGAAIIWPTLRQCQMEGGVGSFFESSLLGSSSRRRISANRSGTPSAMMSICIRRSSRPIAAKTSGPSAGVGSLSF
jgi:hypothetical protein